MKQFPSIDLSLVLSLATVLGLAMAAAGKWLPGTISSLWRLRA